MSRCLAPLVSATRPLPRFVTLSLRFLVSFPYATTLLFLPLFLGAPLVFKPCPSTEYTQRSVAIYYSLTLRDCPRSQAQSRGTPRPFSQVIASLSRYLLLLSLSIWRQILTAFQLTGLNVLTMSRFSVNHERYSILDSICCVVRRFRTSPYPSFGHYRSLSFASIVLPD
ncbi:hypothetical protein EDB83DRAFT_1873862 [Lactarius deliciosus]|nr:hypothetical protein EDB83DRAFT_1873862 [Lactarius deliciosus]